MSQAALDTQGDEVRAAGAAVHEAARLEQAGRCTEAEHLLRRILRAHPMDLDAHRRLLDLLLRTGRAMDAALHASTLVQHEPRLAFAWVRLCKALLNAGREAVSAGEVAVRLAPDDPEACEYLGVALMQAGRHAEAEARLRRALELAPDSATVHGNLANLLTAASRTGEAVEAYRAALRLEPRLTRARYGLALALSDLRQREEAERLLQQVLEEAPDFADAHAAISVLWTHRHAWAEAEAGLRRALALDPGVADVHFNLSVVLVNLARLSEAAAALEQAVRLDPDNGLYRASQVVETLPEVPRTQAEADAAAAAFDRALQDYAAWRSSCGPRALASVRFKRPPFLLAYRDGNHVERLSRFADEVGPARSVPTAPRPPRRRKPRLGIVSAHFRRHSVWDVITKGLLAHLDRSRFEVVLYDALSVPDAETAAARAMCDRWVDLESTGDPSQWAAAIAGDRPDLLFYPALGMDTRSYMLARERLAPVQAVGWGHPITSGLATMDLFFSGELLEPPQAQAHYREQLVRLPGTGACTLALALPGEDLPPAVRETLATCTGARILVPQMPFKFDPRVDAVLARIAQAAGPSCALVIPRYPKYEAAYAVLTERLGAALRARGLDPDAVLKFVPWVTQPQLGALLDEADVVLDSPSFSGYTTAWLAAHHGVPLVTLEGPFLRQRLAAGLYRKLGIIDTVATSEDDYVRLATSMALEGRRSPAGQARRQALRAAAPSADGDASVVRAFERALLQALQAQGTAHSR